MVEKRATVSANLSTPTWMSNLLLPPSGDHGSARTPSGQPMLLTMSSTHQQVCQDGTVVGTSLLRPCSPCSGDFPTLAMSHLFIRCAANSTSQHNILASSGTLVPMRCPIGLVNELRCSLFAIKGNSVHRKSAWSQPSCRLFPTKEPVIHRHKEHPVQVPWSVGFLVRRTQPTVCRSVCGHVLLVFVGSRLSWVTNVPHLRNPVVESLLLILNRPSRRSIQRHSGNFSLSMRCHTRIDTCTV